MITLDSSAIFELLDLQADRHCQIRQAFRDGEPPYLIPVGILGELAYLIESRLGEHVMIDLLNDVTAGAYALDCGQENIPRIRHLMERYADLPLGFVDAAVIACAERNGGKVLSIHEDFQVVAREGTITVFPE